MINIIKRRLFIGICLTTVIIATIGGSVHVYNILSFAIPVLFVLAMFVLFSRSVRKKCIATTKAKLVIGDVESWMWNLSITLLLAAFGHCFLATMWFILWLIFFGVKMEAMKEKSKEEGGTP